MEILLLEENGYVDLRQGIGHLINAIVAVLGPELAPGSTFFSRCKVRLFYRSPIPEEKIPTNFSKESCIIT
jgi:hypothetical protein